MEGNKSAMEKDSKPEVERRMRYARDALKRSI
jgi:hypothetical protein